MKSFLRLMELQKGVEVVMETKRGEKGISGGLRGRFVFDVTL